MIASTVPGSASLTWIPNSLPARSPKWSARPTRPHTSMSASATSGSSSGSTFATENSWVVTACLSFVPAHETRSRLIPRAFESRWAKSLVSHPRRVTRRSRWG